MVFDYDEHDMATPTPKGEVTKWPPRNDPFSSYRAGFEVRTYRLCQRVLMFHHFPGETDVGANCLVRSTDFTYSYEKNLQDVRTPIFSTLLSVIQSGYKRKQGGGYLKKSLPPVEFTYTQPIVNETIREIEPDNLENLPYGVDGNNYQWVDLDAEGTPGILTEQGEGWYYKRNWSPATHRHEKGKAKTKAWFAPLELVAAQPSLAAISQGQQQFLDLAGDGQVDLVQMDGTVQGFYERTHDEDWEAFRPFQLWPNVNADDPNLKFVDLTGDGHADILITEHEAFVWHASLAEEGFDRAKRVGQVFDEEQGPQLVFADGTQSIYLADFSGDGLTDLVRIRNGEVCYWPNVGYGRFGAKVTMDNAPWFDTPDMFDHRRIRLADTDGSGVTDIIYLGSQGVQLYFNQSGNSWSQAQTINNFPHIDNVASIYVTDLFGNGTACLVWSSPLPGDAQRPMRCLDLMGGQKPHLLIATANNLGAETRVQYAPSTKFYVQDKLAGKPWITKLPFPAHVVERVETYDHISRNRFVTHYAYHHGYFDGTEREFRGFGMVEQWDTEEFEVFRKSSVGPIGGEGQNGSVLTSNLNKASHVPPVLTKTWFHTGVYRGRDQVSNFFAGFLDANDTGEYYREPAWRDDDVEAKKHLLADTLLPSGLTVQEEREACRALGGSMLRQEVYAKDGTPKAEHPYTVTEQNFTIRRLQPKAVNRHGVFFTHAREAISYHYERRLVPVVNGRIVDEIAVATNPDTQWLADPRVQHALTLEVDGFGNVLKEATIGYGRRQVDSILPLQVDREKQSEILITYTENEVTNHINEDDAHRTPLPAETRTYELTGYIPSGNTSRFQASDFVTPDPNDANKVAHVVDEDIKYEQKPSTGKQRRLIEQVRTLYRQDNLTSLLELGKVQSLALPGESYKLAFTPGLLNQVYVRNGQKLLSNPAKILPIDIQTRKVADRGGYLSSQSLKNQNLFPKNANATLWSRSDQVGHWWIPSGRIFFSPNTNHNAATELAYAKRHFFLPHRFRGPFHIVRVHPTESFVTYDGYKLLLLETDDALDNRVTVGERLLNGTIDPNKQGNDYRVLQPRLVTGPNSNRTEVAFDAFGLVVGTAVMGKATEALGDLLDTTFEPDLTQTQLDAFIANPREALNPDKSVATQIVHDLFRKATTRIVYDLNRFRRIGEPPWAATIARETHVSDLGLGVKPKLQVSFSYSDGFGREIQKKIQAEPGKVPKRDATGKIILRPNGQPEMTANKVNPRWVGSGWTIFNNKGKPVRQFEPFFTDKHQFEFDTRIGVSPYVFYDPLERVVATLHPNHTYEKVVFDPWRQETWDVNDNVTLEPQSDNNVKGFFLNPDGTSRLPTDDYSPTWHQLRTNPAHALELTQRWPDPRSRTAEVTAAQKAAAHENTPNIAHFDTLGRPFLTLAHNGFRQDQTPLQFPTRFLLDIEGNQREVRDGIEQNGDKQGRIVMHYDYDMLGNRIHQASMEAGERWMLNDVAGNPIRAWDSRGHNFWTEYDQLRRPVSYYVRGTDANASDQRILNRDILFEKTEYGEGQPNDIQLNLRTRVFKQCDGAGVITNMAKNPGTDKQEAYDFKGNLLRSTRQLAEDYKGVVNWSSRQVRLDPRNIFRTSTIFDALNRPMTVVSPDGSVYRPSFNESNLLNRVDVNLRGEQVNRQPKWTPFVINIDYDAKGQRQQIDYATKVGKPISTRYTYDPETFRLVHLKTRRSARRYDGTDRPGEVQNLHYTYDPVGNITHIRDDAQQTIYFKNKRVEPNNDYNYDPLYRLIRARGREHLGQQANGDRNPPTAPDAFNAFHTRLDHPGNGNAMGAYTEHYEYDAVGNFMQMRHRSAGAARMGWTHAYDYTETSLIEDGNGGTTLKTSNRLTRTRLKPNRTRQPRVEPYRYDAHGNIVRMSHLANHHDPSAPNMHWDYKDKMRQTDLGGGGTACYVYDANGERVRKVWEKNGGTLIEERIYLGGFEIFRRRQGRDLLERETLHIVDNQQRIALVETRTQGNEPDVPQQLIRFQFRNHLGSSSLELDYQAMVISYEEYCPYGSTSYQAVRSRTETPKRYRYTGKERDEESGLYYHGARYYAPWLGRWTSVDPKISIQGYEYVRNSPIRYQDPDGREETESPGFLSNFLSILMPEHLKSQMRPGPVPIASRPLQRQAARIEHQARLGGGRISRNALVGTAVLGPPLAAGIGALLMAGASGAATAGRVGLSGLGAGKTRLVSGLIRAGGAGVVAETTLDAVQTGAAAVEAVQNPSPLAIADLTYSALDTVSGLPTPVAEIVTAKRARRSVSQGGHPGNQPTERKVQGRDDQKIISQKNSPSRKSFPNQLPDTLSGELATAQKLGVKPMRPNEAGFEDLANTGRIKWAITEEGELLVIPHTVQTTEISHAVLTGGSPVLAAGEADIAIKGKNAIGIEITTRSGHFLKGTDAATNESLLGLGKQAFKEFGIEFPSL